ncbi:hypothetical protein AVEN_35871-1 [Araneus ventricosus]|uniref:Uncharacterized protein n=1 Tax=Araneus ventricosus TaxID=182803 RepID=A0A4Y2BK69_ARAVE|nr:hypothetical protein AVEN_35871-1 [Araneus ventricosus]
MVSWLDTCPINYYKAHFPASDQRMKHSFWGQLAWISALVSLTVRGDPVIQRTACLWNKKGCSYDYCLTATRKTQTPDMPVSVVMETGYSTVFWA